YSQPTVLLLASALWHAGTHPAAAQPWSLGHVSSTVPLQSITWWRSAEQCVGQRGASLEASKRMPPPPPPVPALAGAGARPPAGPPPCPPVDAEVCVARAAAHAPPAAAARTATERNHQDRSSIGSSYERAPPEDTCRSSRPGVSLRVDPAFPAS